MTNRAHVLVASLLIGLLCVLVPLPSSAQSPSARPTFPRIEWDRTTLSLVQSNGGYARMVRLRDGTMVCAFDFQRGLWVRHSRDNGRTWLAPVNVAAWPFGGLTNSELLALNNGDLLFFYNARPRRDEKGQPFAIGMVRSADGGLTWGTPEILYTGGAEFGNGCWEPAAIQLPGGEVQVFFANESPYRQSDEQEITLLRSSDSAHTWTAPEKISFRSGHRDGMPVPVVLGQGRGIAFAIEDNGLRGKFKPAIVHTTLKDNWRSGVRGAKSKERWGALKVPLAADIDAGAPYLRQMPSGETIISFQQSETGDLKDARMVVCVGDRKARNFAHASTPFPPSDSGRGQLWNSLFVKDDRTVVAISQTIINGVSGIWSVEGRLRRR